MNEPTNTEKIKGLRWSIAEIAANTVFLQLTYFGSVFILFLNELGLGTAEIGLLLSFFPFFGLISLLIAPRVARFGYKRTFITFWGIRKFITALLLLVPFVLDQFGQEVTLIFVAAITMTFGLCRAIAEVGYYPWNQEFVPPAMRGRYSATSNVFSSVVGIITIAFASYIVEVMTGLNRYMLLFAIGIAFGLLGVWFMTRVPGGAVDRSGKTRTVSHRDMLVTFKDRNFWLFIVSFGLVSLATAPMFSFLPLFMKQEVGLSEGNTVLLQNGILIGSLSATFLMGWASDRYGSKPVMLSGLTVMMVLPLIWLVIPVNSGLSLPVAVAAALIQGISTLSWGIGSGRLLFNNVVPPVQRASYMPVYHASIGLIGGISQLLGGVILDFTADFRGEFMGISYNPFTPVFVMGLVLLLTSRLLFNFVRSDSSVSSGQFAGMFVRGNPLLALESMYGYYRARGERAAVAMTERLGQSHSPLTVEELLEALTDPRFNVRYEAVISIARTNPDSRLVEALGNILKGTELALSTVAAWALGRIGDDAARDILREGLNSEYRSIRAHCARALGTLGDASVGSLLLARLREEEDKGLQMAYAAALGSLGWREAVPVVLDQIDRFDNEGARMELALSLTRIAGDETQFIRLLRNIRRDPGTTTAQELETIWRRLKDDELAACIDDYAHDRLDEGAVRLAEWLGMLSPGAFDAEQRAILNRCSERLHGGTAPEYLLLCLTVLAQYAL